MNTLFKKHFWVVNLAGVALLALVVAGGISDVVAGKLFALPAAKWTAPKEGDPAGAIGDLGRVAHGEEAAKSLGTRRIFRLDDPTPVAAVTEPETPKDEPKEEPKPSGELAESQLPINLMGTFVSAVPDFSYATLQIEGEAKIASIGNEYLDGKAKIVKIARGHVVLREDQSYTYVRLWADKTAQAAPPAPGAMPGRPGGPLGKPMPVGGPTPPNPADPAVADTGDAMATPQEGITKTGAYDYSIDRKMLDKQLADISKLQQEARVVPHYQDNQYQGFKLVGVRPGSLYRAIGIRSGDIVTAVNGNKIDSPTKALELFEQLKSSSNISVEIERRGQPKTLQYNIQ
ncbi:MAG: type II secretion system protein GspC [Myxococcota bacterium]